MRKHDGILVVKNRKKFDTVYLDNKTMGLVIRCAIKFKVNLENREQNFMSIRKASCFVYDTCVCVHLTQAD